MGPDGVLPRRLLLPALRALEPRPWRSQPGGADRSSQQPLLFLLHRAVAAGDLLLHGPADRRRGGAVPDELGRWPHLVRLSLPADGLDRSVLRRRTLRRRRSPRADAQGQVGRRADAQARLRDRAQAFDLADDRLVDRRRLGALFQRRADAGEGAPDLPGADDRLYLDRHPDGDDLCARRLHARAGLHLYVPVAAHPGRAHRRMGAQRHLSLRPRREAHFGEEGRGAARARRARRRLRRLLSMRRGLPDRHRHPQRTAARMHPVRALHRRLRQRHDQDRPAEAADRL